MFAWPFKIRRDYRACVILLAVLLSACSNGSSSSISVEPAVAPFTCPIETEGNFAISGSVAIAAGGLLDSDTRAEIAPLVDNGSFAAAQLIPNPVTLGGYASRIEQQPDTNDFYLVELTAGDKITLLVGDAGYDCNYCTVFDDLDLFLYDSNQQLLGMSESDGVFESLTVAEAGLHYIEVRVWEGQSGYVLRIQPAAGAAVAATDALAQEFVPGEIVLVSAPLEAGVLTAQSAALADMESIAGQSESGVLLRMVPQFTASAAVAGSAGSIDAHMRFRDSTDRLKYQTLRRVKELRGNPAYKMVSVNYLLRPTRLPNDALFDQQWHFQDPYQPLAVSEGGVLPAPPGGINLPAAWDYTQGHEDVIVAVIDTGVRPEHPDLQGKLVPGWDFLGGDADPTDPGGNGSVFHGTHVAGTIAAATDNGAGVAGVGWQSRVMPIRAIGAESGTFFDVMQAMLFAADLPNSSKQRPTTGAAAIINLSLGGYLVNPQPLQPVIDDVRAQGVIVIAAAGNNSNSLDFHPASFAGVVSVSAVAWNAQLASYSSFGPNVDVSAPGGGGGLGVLSTSGAAEYRFLSGTSMASPHIAGVVALMQAARLERGMALLTPQQFDFLLAKGQLTRDLGSVGRDDQYGYGLIDAEQAVLAAINNADPELTPLLSVQPSITDFGTDQQLGLLDVRNLGGGELVVAVARSAGADWLTLEYLDAADGLGRYALRVSRAGLPVGSYAASITVTPLQPNPPDVPVTQVVAVSMTVSAAATSSALDELTVALVNAANPYVYLETIPRQQVSAAAPDYSFSDVPAGCYQVVASTDIDGDNLPADIGELWGYWRDPVDEFPVLFLDADAANIDITAGFD